MMKSIELTNVETKSINNIEPVISIDKVIKLYGTRSKPFTALDNISFNINKGEFVFVTGRSGSGKSTLLNIITGIDRPTSGNVTILGQKLNGLNESKLTSFRGKFVGIVFQFYQLIPTLSVVENVILPMDFCNINPKKMRKKIALDLLNQVGILDQAYKLPAKLSGGQQQRVAIARSLATNPPIIVADEPTGNLDSDNANEIFRLLQDLRNKGKTIIVVTHEREITSIGSRIISLSDGKIIDDQNLI